MYAMILLLPFVGPWTPLLAAKKAHANINGTRLASIALAHMLLDDRSSTRQPQKLTRTRDEQTK